MNDRRTLLTAVPALTVGLLPGLTAATSQPGDPMTILATYAAALACYHEGFTLHYQGNNALSGDHSGKPGAIATLRELARRTQWQVLTIDKMLAGKDCAALVARMSYRRDGSTIERDRVLIFAIADGLLRECWAYDQDQQLMDQLIGAS